jgi:hypothetical protein
LIKNEFKSCGTHHLNQRLTLKNPRNPENPDSKPSYRKKSDKLDGSMDTK